MYRIFLVLIFILTHDLSAECQKLVFIKKYSTGFDDETYKQEFKIGKQKFAFDKYHKLYLNDSLLVSISMDSTYNFEVYKNRYLFVSYYLLTPSMSPIATELAPKYDVIVYDLKRAGRKWNFYFAGYNSSAFRWFKPNRSQVKLRKKNIFVAQVK